MLGTRGVDVLVGYGGRLDVEILAKGSSRRRAS